MKKSNLVPFIRENLDILFVGLNPAEGSTDNGHYFSVNQSFWDQLFDAGLITKEVNKSEADEIVFGSYDFNFRGWSYGITDLVTEIAENESDKIAPKEIHCERLKEKILKFEPKVTILLHYLLKERFLPYLGEPYDSANVGQVGKLIKNCPTMFYSIAFPHGNNITSKEKVEKYQDVKNYLLRLEKEMG